MNNVKIEMRCLLLISIGILSLLFSCSNDDANIRVVDMEVAPHLVWVGVRPPGNPEDSVQVMKCSILGANEVLYISTSKIEGFEYVEGYKYRLKVKITELENPPADGYSEKYELIEILSKEEEV